MPAGEVLCRAHGIRKDYPGLRAVDDADLEIRAGEVVGLLGKNGAGKSTLIKILAGVQRADAGTLELGGEVVDLDRLGVAQARALGLAVMFQELELFPGMSVAENIVLTSRPPRRRGLVDFRAMHEAAAAVLATVDPGIDARAGIDALPPAQQRAVMIARAVHQGARLLILDEPTTSLTTREIEALHALVRRLAAAGHAIVYVSHRLDEVRAITDRVVVMRDGAVVASRATGELSMRELVATISGNVAGTTADERRVQRGVDARPVGPVRVAVSGLTVPGVLDDISFDVHAGEILGIGGLVGAGRTELVRALFGADPIHAGTIAVDGAPVRIRRPRDAVREGIVLLPEDRRHQGLVDSFGIRENTTLATLSRFRRRGLPMPSRRREARATAELIEGLKIRARGPEQGVASLSGGNQQKVVIAKWMLREGKLLMFDEPTQGIDVEAKEEVYTLMERFADGGASVVLISSEFSELVGVCRRVIVLREGAIAATLEGSDVTERTITDACYGAGAAPTA